MDRAAARRTPLTEVSVEEVGGGAEGKYKVLTGCRYSICEWYEREKAGWTPSYYIWHYVVCSHHQKRKEEQYVRSSFLFWHTVVVVVVVDDGHDR